MLRSTLEFFLFDWLKVEDMARYARYADHSRGTLESVLETSERIAAERFRPFNRTVDTEEPRLVDGRVIQPACARAAAEAFVASGLLAAGQDYERGGMQLPCSVETAAHAFFASASVGLYGGHMLTVANANLLLAHGTVRQRDVFAAAELAGRWFGTMCLSEPQAGSGLADVATRALPDGADYESDPLGPRYRLFGNKMWISNADHELAENIVHLVLAKIPGPDGRLVPGVRGLSLFIVPKHLADTGGRLTGERNDVCVAGLNHKLGHRGVPNALLNFGEGRQPVRGGPGAIGYRVGAPGAGLACMFHMMNEARIMIGLSAASIGHAGYEASLEYAKTRRQGRPPRAGGRDPASPPVAIVEHADVKRMLLAQKAYAEGGLALALFTADLVDRTRVGTAEEARDAKSLLEFLTPVAKSWSSEWCLEANSLAIQVHGGYGYTRDFLVELLWRDNRLNMIHEGTHGIQAIDLLGRKVVADGGAALDSLGRRIAQTVDAAAAVPAFESHVRALRDAWSDVRTALDAAWAAGDPETATASAVPFLQAFGHVVVAWLWLDVARAAVASGRAGRETPFAHGKCQAARYFFEYELPKVGAWLQPVARGTRACLEATLDALAE